MFSGCSRRLDDGSLPRPKISSPSWVQEARGYPIPFGKAQSHLLHAGIQCPSDCPLSFPVQLGKVENTLVMCLTSTPSDVRWLISDGVFHERPPHASTEDPCHSFSRICLSNTKSLPCLFNLPYPLISSARIPPKLLAGVLNAVEPAPALCEHAESQMRA